MKTALTTLGISLLVLAGCTGQKQPANDFIQENIDNAVAQEMLPVSYTHLTLPTT
mgnify:CR=1 FL=1